MKYNCTISRLSAARRGIWYYWLMKHELEWSEARRCLTTHNFFSVKLLSDDYFRFRSHRGLVHYPPYGQRSHVTRLEIAEESSLGAAAGSSAPRVVVITSLLRSAALAESPHSPPTQTLSTTITGIRIFERLKRQWIYPHGLNGNFIQSDGLESKICPIE